MMTDILLCNYDCLTDYIFSVSLYGRKEIRRIEAERNQGREELRHPIKFPKERLSNSDPDVKSTVKNIR